MKKLQTIAIIGHGRLGKLLVEILLTNTNLQVLVVSSKTLMTSHPNLKQITLGELHTADLVIPCVPISEFDQVIQQIALSLKKDAIIMDVCSVKVLPVRSMQTHLPATVQIIASHPMFGPDAYQIKGTLKGMRIVLWNERAQEENYKEVRGLCKGLRLAVIELSPDEHDKQMAFSLGYSYLIGKIGQRMGVRETLIDTHDFQLVLENIAIVSNDSEQLFYDMQTKNPYAQDMIKKFSQTADKLFEEIKKGGE